MTVRAKMKCESVEKQSEEQIKVTLRAVTDGSSEENKSFSKYTPSADLNLTITNPECFDKFEQGKQYYVDIIPAE